jgi:hypothetical protein
VFVYAKNNSNTFYVLIPLIFRVTPLGESSLYIEETQKVEQDVEVHTSGLKGSQESHLALESVLHTMCLY